MPVKGPLSPEFWGLNPDWSEGPPGQGGAVRPFGSIYVPPNRDQTALRQQQQKFANVVGQLDRENRWMAVPALAPVATVAALETGAAAAAAYAARFARPIPEGPLVFTRRDFPNGNHYAAKIGKEAHAAFKALVEAKQKQGWTTEDRILVGNGPKSIRPDASGPVRNLPKGPGRYHLELKPDTQSGRSTGRAQVRRYMNEAKAKARVVYYDPKTYE